MIKTIRDLKIEFNFDSGPFVIINSKRKNNSEYTIGFWDADTVVYGATVSIGDSDMYYRKWYTD